MPLLLSTNLLFSHMAGYLHAYFTARELVVGVSKYDSLHIFIY